MDVQRPGLVCPLLFLGVIGSCLLPAASTFMQITYEDLQRLNGSCTELDSCTTEVEDDSLSSRSCECGPQCRKYQTCCIDSQHLDATKRRRVRRQRWHDRIGCHSVFNSDSPLFMVTHCKRRWRRKTVIKALCENNTESLQDPLVHVPATNRRSQLVYKNYFCAVCNYDLRGLVLWKIQLARPRLSRSDPKRMDEDTVLHEMAFNEDLNAWGLPGETDDDFHAFVMSFVPPRDLEHLNHTCIPNVVSDCDPAWKDEEVRKKCRAYMSAIWAKMDENVHGSSRRRLYRNIHCAICNFADTGTARCYYRGRPEAGKVPLSLPLLLDVNPKDGELVGKANRCGKREAYDPFFRKCRALVCGLPGFRLSGRRCVRA